MTAQTHRLAVLDPTVRPTPAHADMATRLESLDGKTIGLLANGKRNSEEFLGHLAAIMAEHYQIKGIVARNKRNVSRPCPELMMQELLDQCDVLVTASGD